jgi:tRNA-dihydrouridine synthase
MTTVLPAVAAARPDFVTLHFRTAAENYDPVPAGWQRLARARELLCRGAGGAPIPLVGCGDVLTAADALRLHCETGVDGVAAARGLMRNPLLLRHIENACAGQLRPLPSRQTALAALGEMASLAAAAKSGRPGFVLEVARNMLGEDDPLFQELARCRTLCQAAERLAAAVAKGVHEPQSRAQSTA